MNLPSWSPDFSLFRMSNHEEVEEGEEEEEEDSLKAIFDQQWRVHWVTPLRNVSYTEAALKQYAAHLRAALQSEAAAARVEVKVAALPGLRQQERNPTPLQISAEAVDGGNKRQRVYNGIMLSWTQPQRPELDNLVHLPLLLCRGGKKTLQMVHSTLSLLLDCSIRELTFENRHMLWMIGFAAHFHAEELDDLRLRFNCPGLGDQNFIDYTMQIGLLKAMWTSTHGPDKQYITYDEILSLRDKCYAYLQDIYGLRVSMLQLIRIRWKGLSFSINGHIKLPRGLTKLLLEFIENIGYSEERSLTGMLFPNKRARHSEVQ